MHHLEQPLTCADYEKEFDEFLNNINRLTPRSKKYKPNSKYEYLKQRFPDCYYADSHHPCMVDSNQFWLASFHNRRKVQFKSVLIKARMNFTSDELPF